MISPKRELALDRSNSTASNPPPLRRIDKAVPLVVAASLIGVSAWSAWPLIRPARSVTVVQVVMDRSVQRQAEQSIADDAKPINPGPTVQAPGWLEAEPFFRACTALADGVVESIDALEGDFVEQGQVVARLVAVDSELRLRRAESQVSQAEAALDLAKAEHNAATSAWNDPVDLERAIATSRAALAESEGELAQLPSLIESGRATLIRLNEEADRIKRSTQAGAATEFELVVADQRAAAQRAEVAALEARRPILEARIDRLRAELRADERDFELRIEDHRRLAATKAQLDGAAANLLNATAARDEAALELERMVIRAPISGYVQRRLKIPGDKVVRMMDSPHSAHIVHLYDPDRLQVRVDVPLVDASHIRVGQPCEVIVEVLPDRVFKGEVLLITHEADLQKNTLQIKVKIHEPDPILRPEMLARVKFLPARSSGDAASSHPGTAQQRVLIPTAALDRQSSTARVWLVTDRRNGRGTLAARNVQVLSTDGDWHTVEADLVPGALLATGLERPTNGERVVIRPTRVEGSSS